MARKELNRKPLIIIRHPLVEYNLKTGVVINGKIYYFQFTGFGNKFLGTA